MTISNDHHFVPAWYQRDFLPDGKGERVLRAGQGTGHARAMPRCRSGLFVWLVFCRSARSRAFFDQVALVSSGGIRARASTGGGHKAKRQVAATQADLAEIKGPGFCGR